MTLPQGWEQISFEELTPPEAPIIYGILQPGSDIADGVPYIRPTEIRDGIIDVSSVRRTSVAIAERYSRSSLEASDTILTIVGTIGKVAGVPLELEGGNITQSSCRIRADKRLVSADFVRAYLLSPGAKYQYAAKRLGTAVPRLNIADIRRFELPLPPAAEQRRIVAKLDKLTAHIAGLRAELDQVPVMARSLRQSALSFAQFGLLSAPWRQAHPAILGAGAALERVRGVRANGRKPIRRVVGASLDLPLPETWAQVSPDELAADVPYSIGIGPFGSDLVKADYRESGTRLVFVRDIRAQQFGHVGAKYVSDEKAEKLKAHSVQSGDVLVTKMGDPPGDVALFTGDASAIITADCIKLRAHDQLAEPDYLLFCLRFPCVQEQITAATKGVAQQKISLDSFRRMALPIPPVAEQRHVARLLGAAFARADRLEAEAARARALLDRLEAAILAKAFRGQLVPQDPNDEPASVLLDRIRAERAAAPKPKRGPARKAVG